MCFSFHLCPSPILSALFYIHTFFPEYDPDAGKLALCFLQMRTERYARAHTEREKQADRIIRIQDTLPEERPGKRMQKGNFFLSRNYRRFAQKITLGAVKEHERGDVRCVFIHRLRGSFVCCGNCENIFQMNSPIVLQPHLSFSCHRERFDCATYLLACLLAPSLHPFVRLSVHHPTLSQSVRAQSSCHC